MELTCWRAGAFNPCGRRKKFKNRPCALDLRSRANTSPTSVRLLPGKRRKGILLNGAYSIA
jgi:hypothetical protein